MSIARSLSPVAVLRRLNLEELRYQAGQALGALLFHLAGGTALLTLLAMAYVAKRALGLDIVPGLDMLPDEEIEEALVVLARMLDG